MLSSSKDPYALERVEKRKAFYLLTVPETPEEERTKFSIGAVSFRKWQILKPNLEQ